MPPKQQFTQTIFHAGLNKSKTIKAYSIEELNIQIRMQTDRWHEEWMKKKAQIEKKRADEETKRKIQDRIDYAEKMSIDAEHEQTRLDTILVDSLNIDKKVIGDYLDHSLFTLQKPQPPVDRKIPRPPMRDDPEFNPEPPLLIKLSQTKMREFQADNHRAFMDAYDRWNWNANQINEDNQRDRETYARLLAQWTESRDNFYDAQNAINHSIISGLKEGDPDQVESFYLKILNGVSFPFDFQKEFSLEYHPEEKMLIMDFRLPTTDDLPNVKAYSYNKSRDEINESYYPDSYINKKYDSVIYQIVLVYLNYLFTVGREFAVIESVAMNGMVRTIDRSTGNPIAPYVLSVRVSAEAFKELNLATIDPKAWFRKARGISASSIATVTPVAPVIQMDKEDDRFIESYSVVEQIDDSVNLAAMDWKDFENLIREVFEQEFSRDGGEVKITQASRDGGVDAVVFDPDPIRGGKIVIQAKRYTNVVGVSAVRDLYGTVMNEGAIKGILVTTSHYGNDAYEFANGKPITLLTGGNLLSLMEKHGHKAKIDLEEAKRIIAEQ